MTTYIMATFGDNSVSNMTFADIFAQQLGVVRLLQILQQNQQPISLETLAEIFHQEAKQEERLAIGLELSAFLQTLRKFSTMFSIEVIPPEISVRMNDNPNIGSLAVLNGVQKLQAIVIQKRRLNIRQLSTFYNQQSSRDERQIIGKNPATLKQTIQALPFVFNMNGDFITVKVENNADSAEDKISSVDGRGDASQFPIYPRSAPVSYASAVTTHTVNDDEQSKAYRACISKLRNKLAAFGTTTFSQLDLLLTTRGTLNERRALGETPELLRATLKRLPNIFKVKGHFVGLVEQAAEVNGLAEVVQFLKSNVSADVTDICDFVGHVGQKGTCEEREAFGTNPSKLRETLGKFPDRFTFNGRFVSLTGDQSESGNTCSEKAKSTLPAFQIKHTRTRDVSIGVDSGFEGSVTFDQSDSEGSVDADLQYSPCDYIGGDSSNEGVSVDQSKYDDDASADYFQQRPSDSTNGKGSHSIISNISSSTRAINEQNTTSVIEVIDNQPAFIMVDVAGSDSGFSEFKQEFTGRSDNKPVIIGITMSEDFNRLAISCWGNKVYVLNMPACLTLIDMENCLIRTGNAGGCVDVCSILKDVLQSTRILKIVYDCRWMASSLYQRYGYNLVNVFDTMIAHQLLTCDDSTGLEELCVKYGGVAPPDKWRAIGGIEDGKDPADIRVSANARVLVPHLYQQMTARFRGGREKEVVRLCTGAMQTSYL